MESIIWSVVGYIRLKLTSDDIRPFFDSCQKEGIELKNVRYHKGNYWADIISTKLGRVVCVAKRTNTKIGVEGRFGLAMKIFLYRNRRCFYVLFALFLALFFLNPFFVGDIVITGNKYLTDTQIKELLGQNGVHKGAYIPGIDPSSLQSELQKSCVHLSWVWADIKGTSVYVDVREKIPRPDFFQSDIACNIVAERDGVISEAIAEQGILYAQAGTYVREGELLIGGVYDSNENAPVRLVHAKGKVYANTSYTLSSSLPCSYTSYTYGAKEKSSFCINIGKKSFSLWAPKSDSDLVRVSCTQKTLTLFGKISLPLGFTKTKYCEIIKTENILDKDAAKKRSADELYWRLVSMLPPDAKVIGKKVDTSVLPGGDISATVTLECIEDIGKELIIEKT